MACAPVKSSPSTVMICCFPNCRCAYRQGKQSPLVATDCGNRPTAEPLLAPGTAVQLWFTPVRRPQGTHAGKPHDGGGITLLIPPSPSDHRSAQSQPPPLSSYLARDMLSNGLSLPALMRLMGHSKIQTTMLYVQLTPEEVYQQYARAVAQQIRRVPSVQP